MASMERDYFYPAIADRDAPRTWEENGALTARDRARVKAREILASHHPRYLSDAQEAEIAKRFRILV